MIIVSYNILFIMINLHLVGWTSLYFYVHAVILCFIVVISIIRGFRFFLCRILSLIGLGLGNGNLMTFICLNLKLNYQYCLNLYSYFTLYSLYSEQPYLYCYASSTSLLMLIWPSMLSLLPVFCIFIPFPYCYGNYGLVVQSVLSISSFYTVNCPTIPDINPYLSMFPFQLTRRDDYQRR